MNHRIVAKYLGQFAIAIAAVMLIPVPWALYFGEWIALSSFLISICIAALFGLALRFLGRNASNRMFQREAFGIVGSVWFVAALLGALPFFLSGSLSPVDAFFESMSGFTTTGSSIMTDIEAMPKSILFWRSFTHWLGGMGIVVLFIAVLPYLGAGGKQLFKSESPGPDPRGLRPRIRDTASTLYKLYLLFTVIQTLLLMLAGMNLFDALCHTFGTLATGGFSTRNASIAAYDSLAIEIIIIVFMVFAGMNFAHFFNISKGDWFSPFRDTEWKAYILILALSVLLITLSLVAGEWPPKDDGLPHDGYTVKHALRTASFQVASIMTTTGFGTDDFDTWPYFTRALLVCLMIIGGCAGSTGGGLKVVRMIMILKMAYWRLERTFRPKTVRAIRVSKQVIDDDIQKMVYAFMVLYIFWFILGTLYLSALNLPLETAATAVIACLSNIGPGLEIVGPTQNFSTIPPTGKIFLSLCMALGRLEFFSICVFFVPSFWKKD